METESSSFDLNVRDLSLSFGGLKALDNVSFSVKHGDFVGLMGPNGAGKTTAINCISRIYEPTSGSVEFNGQNLLDLKGHQIAELGIARTFQDLNFFSHISDMLVIDYLKLGQFATDRTSLLSNGFRARAAQRADSNAKKKAREILDFFREMRESFETSEEQRGYPFIYGREGFPDLIDVEYRPIGNLSFAWRRRLDLARALVSSPKLLLLDEPAQGLPQSEIANLGKILRRIKDEFKVSALIVEHNVSTLLAISEKIVVLNFGKKIAEGVPEEVRQNPEVIDVYLGESSETSRIKRIEPVATAKSDPLLEIKNIDLFYGQAQALYQVSAQIYPNQICCVLGVNGSGKSTLLRAISGVEKPTSGEIFVNGEYLPLGWPERAVEMGIQYVPQGRVIFPELTVMQNLKMGGYLQDKAGRPIEKDIDRIFNYFPQLKEVLNEQAASLSGGLQQMVAIAQALIGRPKLLMLDEPTLGLAPIFVDLVFSIIQRIRAEEGCSILLVEQNVLKALDISDYVYMVNVGVVIGQGEAEKFRNDGNVIKKYLGFA